MTKIEGSFSYQNKIERSNNPSISTNRTSSSISALFKNPSAFFTTAKAVKANPSSNGLKSAEISASIEEIVQMDREISSLKANNANPATLEPSIQKRNESLQKLTQQVARTNTKELADACIQIPKTTLQSAMAVLKEAKADTSSILLLLLKEQKFPEYKCLVSATFGFKVPAAIIDAEKKMLQTEIGKQNYKKVAVILDSTYSIPKTLNMSKKEIVTLSKGMIQQTINEKVRDPDNYFNLTTEFEKIKTPNDTRLEIFCETARDLLLAGDKVKYGRLEKCVMESSASEDIKDLFLSSATAMPEKSAIEAIKTNLNAGNLAMVKTILMHTSGAGMEAYAELSELGKIEQCAQLLSLARDCNLNISGLIYLRKSTSGARQTNELAIARDKQLNGALSPTKRQALIHNTKLSSSDLMRTLGDLNHMEMISLARREGASRVIQTVFEHSPQNMKTNLLRFMSKWENNRELLKEMALSGNETLCKAVIDSHIPFHDKQPLLQVRAEILSQRPQNHEKGAALLASIASQYP